jgi:hypothetical protein
MTTSKSGRTAAPCHLASGATCRCLFPPQPFSRGAAPPPPAQPPPPWDFSQGPDQSFPLALNPSASSRPNPRQKAAPGGPLSTPRPSSSSLLFRAPVPRSQLRAVPAEDSDFRGDGVGSFLSARRALPRLLGGKSPPNQRVQRRTTGRRCRARYGTHATSFGGRGFGGFVVVPKYV